LTLVVKQVPTTLGDRSLFTTFIKMKLALLGAAALSVSAEMEMFADNGVSLLQLRAQFPSDDNEGIGKMAKMAQIGMDVEPPSAAALAQLHKQTEAPLYDNVLMNAQVPDASCLDRAVFEEESGQGPVTLVAYHKTGYELSDRLLSTWSSLTGDRYAHASKQCTDGWSQNQCTPTFVKPDAELQLVVVPPANFTLPAKAPTIHFVRHPMDLIISAYRYHLQTPEGWEKHRSSPLCFECSKADWQTIFGLCSEQCPYLGLLRSLPEEEGILVEAVGMRRQTQRMLSNVLAWASDPNVLHLSIEHLGADFDKTMRCIDSFLGLRGFRPEHLKTLEESLRLKPTDPHLTGGKYDNARIENTLLSAIAWASEFSSASQVLSDIFVRQGLHYDCPVP